MARYLPAILAGVLSYKTLIRCLVLTKCDVEKHHQNKSEGGTDCADV